MAKWQTTGCARCNLVENGGCPRWHAWVCVRDFCSRFVFRICVLIAESNCVFASLKTRPCSLLPICRHSCEWLLLSSSAENGEIRALTSNLFSNSTPSHTHMHTHMHTARNVRQQILESGIGALKPRFLEKERRDLPPDDTRFFELLHQKCGDLRYFKPNCAKHTLLW